MIPTWLHALSVAYLALGGACAAVIVIGEMRRPQRMAIMNVVWPVTALFGTVGVLALYVTHGRPATRHGMHAGMRPHGEPAGKDATPFSVMVGKGALHCGSGCMLGDICAEWLVFWVPAIPVALGWHSIFHDGIFAAWIVDFVFAYAFGIVFQYFTIAPMRGLSVGQGLVAAVKADTLSLTAWQFGMYGFMAIAYFVIFRIGFGVTLEPDRPAFWFMMQIAMICGFATSYPVNWWLLRAGFKEKM